MCGLSSLTRDGTHDPCKVNSQPQDPQGSPTAYDFYFKSQCRLVGGGHLESELRGFKLGSGFWSRNDICCGHGCCRGEAVPLTS